MVGRVVDRRRPDLAQPEAPRDRHVARESLPVALVRRPVDLARLPGRLVRIAPAEQEAALLEAPVEAGSKIEDHRHPLDGERVVRLEHGDRVARRTRRDP